MYSRFALVLLTFVSIILSGIATAKPSIKPCRLVLAKEKITGYLQIHAWRGIFYPYFEDEEGRKIELKIHSKSVADEMRKLTSETGRAYVTLSGEQKDGAFDVASVEKFKLKSE